MQAVTIRGRTLQLPILQGGMGVGVSLGGLAGAVAACGGMGTISTAVAGFNEPDFDRDPNGANLRALEKEIKKAKELAGGLGMVAINAMVATTQYADSIRTALRAGVDAVVCGAGLAVDLPAIAGDADVALAPIVSSSRAAATLCKLWYKRFGVLPDFMVVEGPLAGGHLGFEEQDVKNGSAQCLETLVPAITEQLRPFEELLRKIEAGWEKQRVCSWPPGSSAPTSAMPPLPTSRPCWMQSRRTCASCTARWACPAGR